MKKSSQVSSNKQTKEKVKKENLKNISGGSERNVKQGDTETRKWTPVGPGTY